MPLSVTRTTDVGRPRVAPARRSARPCAPNFEALCSRFAKTCARRTPSPSTTRLSSPASTDQAAAVARRSTAGWSPRRRPARRRIEIGARCSNNRPRDSRDTSSRSSSRRVICAVCRSMVSAQASTTSLRRSVGAEHARGGANRRQRIAELVGQHRQEQVLLAIGVAQLRLEALPLRQVVEVTHHAPAAVGQHQAFGLPVVATRPRRCPAVSRRCSARDTARRCPACA